MQDSEPAGAVVQLEEVAGIRGSFLPMARKDPASHAIAVVLGRAFVWATVNGIAQRPLQGLLTQFALTKTKLGQKYHGKSASSMFGGICRVMCGELAQVRFWDPPASCPCPSAWPHLNPAHCRRNGQGPGARGPGPE